MALLGHLTPLHGGESIPLTAEVLLIGRDRQCDVVVPHRSVSARHCRIAWRKGTWVVEDQGSHNGTFVGRTQIQKARVKSGATLRLGAVRFELTAVPSKTSAAANADEDLAMNLLGDSNEQVESHQNRQSREDSRSTSGSKPSSADRVATRRATAGTSLQSPAGSSAAAQQKSVSSSSPKRSSTRTPERENRKRPAKRFLGKLTPKAGGDPIALLEERIVIGRGRDCGIRLKYATVSTQHCLLKFHEGHWSAHDLESRNGIRVNSQPTQEDWLMPGDILSIGRLRFEIDYVQESQEQPPAFDLTGGMSLLEKAGLTRQLEGDKKPDWLVTDQDPEPSQRVDLESM